MIETNGARDGDARAREAASPSSSRRTSPTCRAAAIPAAPQWIPDRLNFFVVGYNTQKVRRDEMPADYEGFLDPKWKGRIGLEATDSEWMATLVKRWGDEEGMDYFRKLADMRPDMRKGHVLLAELVAAGEIPVGLTMYNATSSRSSARARRSTGCRCSRWSRARRASAIAQERAASATRRCAFVDFVLSPEGQELFDSMGRVPVSTKVKTRAQQVRLHAGRPGDRARRAGRSGRSEWERAFHCHETSQHWLALVVRRLGPEARAGSRTIWSRSTASRASTRRRRASRWSGLFFSRGPRRGGDAGRRRWSPRSRPNGRRRRGSRTPAPWISIGVLSCSASRTSPRCCARRAASAVRAVGVRGRWLFERLARASIRC